MSPAFLEPEPLGRHHQVAGFECRSPELQDWLRRHARQSQADNFTKVLVTTARGYDDVASYYAWTVGSVSPADAPSRLSAGGGQDAVPVALLARLAVDTRHERQGLGRSLLRDVLLRTLALSQEAPIRALLVHCESAAAKGFYLRHVPAFEPSPTDPMHLLLLIKDLRRACGRFRGGGAGVPS